MAEFLNNNIKYLRSKKNLSQQSLADKVGVDRSTISRIENNEIETTIPVAEKIAKTLEIPFADLVSKDLRIPQPKQKKEYSPEEEKQMLKESLIRKGFLDENEELTEENYNRLIEFAKANKQFIMKDDSK